MNVVALSLAHAAMPPATATSRLIGGKARGLCRLLSTPGIQVPAGFVVTTAAFEQYLEIHGLTSRVAELVLLLNDRADFQQIESRASELAKAIRCLRLTRELTQLLAQCHSHLVTQMASPLGFSPPLIARSSAVTEDAVDDSRAGAFESIFPIRTLEQLHRAIPRIWASVFAPQALERASCVLRRGGAIDRGHFSMAVVIQEWLRAQCAGVAFNHDIRRDGVGVLIEAVMGHADKLVAGLQTPDAWLFDPQGEVLWEQRTSSGDRSPRCVLTKSQARCIARSVVAISQAHRELTRVDTEFVWSADRGLFFVQARPQTAACPPVPANAIPHDADALARLESLESCQLGGETAARGAVAGRLLVVAAPGSKTPEIDDYLLARRHLLPGDLLVTRTTNIGWTLLFGKVAGIVAERGGVMSHTAIVARERGLPAVVGAQHIVSNLSEFCDRTAIKRTHHEPGAWSIPHATLDAFDRCIYPTLVSLHALNATSRTIASSRPTQQAQARVEFVHFVDESGREWTGKPDHPLGELQFELYFQAWRRALRMLRLSAAEASELPLARSLARLTNSSGRERERGVLRFDATQKRFGDEYSVVAFPTAELARLGDRLRLQGLNSREPTDPRQPLADMLQFHTRRKSTLQLFERIVAELRGAVHSPYPVNLARVFQVYIELISFAHLRAAFRRRVADPLAASAIESLPDSVRAQCQSVILEATAGLATETTHRRDPRYRVLLGRVAQRPLRDLVMQSNSTSAWKELRETAPSLARRIEFLNDRFKLERRQSDRLDDPASVEAWLDSLRRDLLAGLDALPVVPTLTRTTAGFRQRLAELRPLILAANSSFDYDSFESILVLARESPVLTDRERHAQHRFHVELRRLFQVVERDAVAADLLLPDQRLADHSPQEVLRIFQTVSRRFL